MMSVVKSREVKMFAMMLHVMQEVLLEMPSRMLSVNLLGRKRKEMIKSGIPGKKKRYTDRTNKKEEQDQFDSCYQSPSHT